MKTKTVQKRPRLGSKLKAAMQNISVDVFGYEAKVTKNVIRYFTELASSTKIPKERLFLRIFKHQEDVRIGIYQQGKLVKQIPVSELITVFTDSPSNPFFSMESKTTNNIKTFLEQHATVHEVALSTLHLCIFTGPDKVWVIGYSSGEPLGDIPLKTLIKHFIG